MRDPIRRGNVRTIWKFQLPKRDQCDLLMPVGARLLAVGADDTGVYLWAEVVDGLASESRRFCLVPTGTPIPSTGRYIGTAFAAPFVWHVYEVV